MEWRKTSKVVYLAILKVCFHTLSFIHNVFKNNWAYRKKLRLGAIIITLTVAPLSAGTLATSACLSLIEPMEDEDGDGLYSSYEWDVFDTDPYSVDTDQDGTPDGDEDHDGDGITNWEYQLGEETPLIAAIEQGHTQKALVMLAAGAEDVDATDARGRTALIAAAWTGNIKVVEVLLEARATVNIRDTIGRTALGWAIAGGHDEVQEMLRNSGAVSYTHLRAHET